MLILRRLPRMTVFFVRRQISWSEFKLGLTIEQKECVHLRKGGGLRFIERDMEKEFFGF